MFIGDVISKVDIMKRNTPKYKLSKFVTNKYYHTWKNCYTTLYSSPGWVKLGIALKTCSHT